MMNQYPFIPPLDTKQVKELVRQIRVLRYDYPSLSDQELADEWVEAQHRVIEEGRACPYADWIEGDRWRQGFQRAVDHAARMKVQKQRAKESRQRWKDIIRDKQPSTPAQQRYVKRLAKKHNLVLDVPPDQMSKLAASRMIQKLIDAPPPEST
jgi:hypothetical protein